MDKRFPVIYQTSELSDGVIVSKVLNPRLSGVTEVFQTLDVIYVNITNSEKTSTY